MDALLDSPTQIHDTYEAVMQDKSKLEGRVTGLMWERNQLFKNLPYEDNAEIVKDVARLTRDKNINSAYARVVERIKAKTSLFSDYEEAQMVDSLLWELAESEHFQGLRVRWGYGLAEDIGAQYLPKRGQINLVHTVPTKTESLLSFAQTGNLPTGSLKLLHEHAHSLQVPPGTKIEDSTYHKDIELYEAHAYKMGEQPVGSSSNASTADFIKEAGLYGERDVRLNYALEVVDQMLALRYDVKEITDLIRRPGKWDPGRKCYTRIQAEIDKDLKAAGFSSEDFKKLVKAHRLEREITYLKVMHIAQNEIKNSSIKFVQAV